MRARDSNSDVGPELAEELLRRGQQVALLARGTSMAPLIRDGDRLQLAPLDHPPRKGDLVAALSLGRLLVHRVLRVRGGEARLQGDALWSSDGWFVFEIHEACVDARVIGRVAAIRRGELALGGWRLAGPVAKAWMAALPLVRLCRGLLRRIFAKAARLEAAAPDSSLRPRA